MAEDDYEDYDEDGLDDVDEVRAMLHPFSNLMSQAGSDALPTSYLASSLVDPGTP
jgi:hypothetical protein